MAVRWPIAGDLRGVEGREGDVAVMALEKGAELTDFGRWDKAAHRDGRNRRDYEGGAVVRWA